VRRKTSRCAASPVSLRMLSGMWSASTVANPKYLSQSSEPGLKWGRNAVSQLH
jgi:hypothetical protein